MEAFDGMAIGAIIGTIIFGIIGALVAAVATWIHAPQVGGEWWIYIRALASIVMLSVGGSVGATFGQFAGGLFGAFFSTRN
jgi:hypothetical protein